MVVTQLSTPHGAPRLGTELDARSVALGTAHVRFTDRRDGDLANASDDDAGVEDHRRAVLDRPWSWLTQVHGAEVTVVTSPGGSAGQPADAAVSAVPGVALAVVTADCAPVAFASPEGVIGVAHAGWRGLTAGVIEETVAALRSLGAGSVQAALGPCIHAECYAFGAADLDALADRLGPEVRGETADGAPALDVPRAVRSALARSGAQLVVDADVCTSCSSAHWSWRARQDRQRQATVVWQP